MPSSKSSRSNRENNKSKLRIIPQSINFKQLRFIKKFATKFNLTSDYNSSNKSPSGSENTADEIINLTNLKYQSNQSECLKTKATSVNKDEVKKNDKIEKNQNIYKNLTSNNKLSQIWSELLPVTTLPSFSEQENGYMIDNICYDLNQLANDPLLNLIDQWDYPIFDLSEATGDAILSKLSYRIFFETGLFETFKIPIAEFLKYFRALENGYRDKPCKLF